MVERSDTHQLRLAKMMGFAKGSTPSYRTPQLHRISMQLFVVTVPLFEI